MNIRTPGVVVLASSVLLGCPLVNGVSDTAMHSEVGTKALYESARGLRYFPDPSKTDVAKDTDAVQEDWYVAIGDHLGPVDIFDRVTKKVDGKDVPVRTVNRGDLFKPGDRFFVGDAWTYCRNLEQQSAKASSLWAWIGIPSLGVGLPTAIAGTTLSVAEAAKSDVGSDKLAARLSLAAGGYIANARSLRPAAKQFRRRRLCYRGQGHAVQRCGGGVERLRRSACRVAFEPDGRQR